MTNAAMNVGDVISIDQIRADGTIGPGLPVKRWRVIRFQGPDVKLQPLHEDGSIDEFNDAAGEYWIRGGPVTS